MQTLRERPRILLLARNPLLLSMIAYLYADQHIALPHSRAEFYRYSTTLLLEKWQGAFNRYGVPAKSAVLSRLALRFQAQPAEDQDRRSLTYAEVLQLVREVLPGTAVRSEDAADLLDEIVDRSGLLLRIDGGTRFQFTHLTMQEYFGATALTGERVQLLEKFRNDPDAWREVIKLWCGMAQDSTEMVCDVFGIERITAIECLADAKYIAPEVTDKIAADAWAMLQNELTESSSESLERAFGLLASAHGSRVALPCWAGSQACWIAGIARRRYVLRGRSRTLTLR